MKQFTTKFEVKWADVDPNMHLRHSVYLDYADQARIRFFNQNGLPFRRLQELGVGPIIFGTQANFMREIMLAEKLSMDCHLIELSPDGRKWHIRHYVYKEDGTLAAELNYRGAWLDLKVRKIVVPPEDVVRVMSLMDKESVEASIS